MADIELHADGDRIVKAKNACSLGESLHCFSMRILPLLHAGSDA